jgi:hypothetical protein
MPEQRFTAKTPLNDALSGASDEGPTLPAIHMTTSFAFDAIFTDRELKPQKCDVFAEDLLYFYYGRIAYRTKSTEPLESEAYAPVVLLLRCEGLNIDHGVYPFDTGGRDLYETAIPKEAETPNFRLRDLAAEERLINAFWESPNAYYYFRLAHLRSKPLVPSDRHARMYQDLLNAKGGHFLHRRSQATRMTRSTLLRAISPTLRLHLDHST